MKVFLTGASGYIGHKLAHTLAAEGHQVHALVRSDEAKKHLQHANINIFKGNVLQKETLLPAMEGCQQVYHTAAKVGAWAKRQQDFYEVNVGGTKNVLDAATTIGVERLVFTSTAGVLGPSNDQPVNENSKRLLPFQIDYDRSKNEAENLVETYVNNGTHVVVVSPAKVYGPGHTSHSLTANAIINTFLKKGIAFIPSPGSYKICFAYVDDVIRGHIQAMEKGIAGQRYILGGMNISYYDFFHCIRTLSGGKGRIVAVPKAILKGAAYAQEISHWLTGASIRFPVNSVDHLFSNYIFSSDKAVQQLGYRMTSLEEAIGKTIRFLKTVTNA